MDSIEFWNERRQRQREGKRRRNAVIAAWLFCVVMIGSGTGTGLYFFFKAHKVNAVEFAPTLLSSIGYAALGGLLGFGLTLLYFIRHGFNRFTMEEIPGAIPKNPWRPAAVVGYATAAVLAALLSSAEQMNRFDGRAFGSALAGGLPALALGWVMTSLLTRRPGIAKLRSGRGG